MTTSLGASPAPHGPRPARAALVRRAAIPAVVLGLLGGAAGVVLASEVPASHTASSTVLLNPLEGNPFHPGGSGEDLINLTTEAEVVRSDAVAALVAADLGSSDAAAQLTGVSVDVLPNTQILEIAVTARRPEAAVERAGAFADAYLQYRIQRASTSTDVERKQLQDEITERNEQLQELAEQYADAEDDPPKAALISAQIQTTTTQLTQLNARLVDSTSDILDPGQVVTVAALQPEGLLSVPRLLPLVGAAAGAGIALLGAWLWGRRDRTLRRSAQVEDLVPVLAVDRAPAVPAWDAPVTDDLRRVRAELPALLGDARHVIAAVSLGPHAPGHVAPLALATSAAGMRTAVVDLTGELADGSGEGLAGVLTSGSDPTAALTAVAPDVDVLPPGVGLAAVGDLVAGARFDALLDALLLDHGLVVVVVRAGGPTAEQVALRHASAAIVEVRLRATRTSALRGALEACTSAGVPGLVAAVVPPGPHRRRAADAEDGAAGSASPGSAPQESRASDEADERVETASDHVEVDATDDESARDAVAPDVTPDVTPEGSTAGASTTDGIVPRPAEPAEPPEPTGIADGHEDDVEGDAGGDHPAHGDVVEARR